MGVTACCILTLVVMACGPCLAQGPTQDQKPEPKQGDPLREGTHVGLKQSCGGEMTVDGSGMTITSPGYPGNYGNQETCEWTFTAQEPDTKLEFECDDFDLDTTENCEGDSLIILEDMEPKFCVTGTERYESEGNMMRVIFRTDTSGTASGFSCFVRSISGNSTSGSSRQTCVCGIANTNRIVGGEVVSPKNKYPWHVGLKYRTNSNYYCGGSIINDRFVMTAAHCVVDSNGDRYPAADVKVGVADHNKDSTSDDVAGVTRLVGVRRVYVHRRYSDETYDFDIALLKLKEPLDLSAHTQLGAVCLPTVASKTYKGEMATATGWGTLQSGGQQPAKLREVSVPILSPSCDGYLKITRRMLCAGLEQGGKDTCQGDSGGPLFVQEGSKNVQVGITSWGFGCANAESPGVYTRVSRFRRWIKRRTKRVTPCK